MRKPRLCFLFLMFGLINATNGFTENNLILQVKVKCDKKPSMITINEEGGVAPHNLERLETTDIYRAIIPRNFFIKKNKIEIVYPYRIVGDWGDSKEQIFLGVRPDTPRDINLTMYHYVRK